MTDQPTTPDPTPREAANNAVAPDESPTTTFDQAVQVLVDHQGTDPESTDYLRGYRDCKEHAEAPALDPMVPGMLRTFADDAERSADIAESLRRYADQYARAASREPAPEGASAQCVCPSSGPCLGESVPHGGSVTCRPCAQQDPEADCLAPPDEGRRLVDGRPDAGPWQHDDGTPCPVFLAPRPAPRSGGRWWCTEHQSHLSPAPSVATPPQEGGWTLTGDALYGAAMERARQEWPVPVAIPLAGLFANLAYYREELAGSWHEAGEALARGILRNAALAETPQDGDFTDALAEAYDHGRRDATPAPAVAVDGAALIADERRRQIEAKGWTAEHDVQHTRGELVGAAMVYLGGPSGAWPWTDTTPDLRGSEVDQLVKGGALIAAEIDRLRATVPPAPLAVGDTVTTVEELDALPVGAVVRAGRTFRIGWRTVNGWETSHGDNGMARRFLRDSIELADDDRLRVLDLPAVADGGA